MIKVNSPLVSIIIPCYNYGNFLGDAVLSVIAQTYHNWECLIIDDGSADNTANVAQGLVVSDTRVKYHYKENGGLSSARNSGIDISKGEFVCFLDADDRLDKDKLLFQIQCFQQHPDSDIVYGHARFFEKSDVTVLYNNKAKSKNEELIIFQGQGNDLMKYLLKSNITVISAPLIRKTVFVKAGKFDLSYKSYEDWHFWIKCALANQYFYFCEKPAITTYIRFGHESMMSDKRKLIRAGLQLRKFLMPHLSLKSRLYNQYRMFRSQLKLMLAS